MSDILALKAEILRTHGVRSGHVASTRVTYHGPTAWDGVVEMFELYDHPSARHCYAWSFQNDSGGTEYAVVLRVAPVDSLAAAVRAGFRPRG